ncbi:hypothetical protein [Microbacterium allomyrinae]|uniref:Uncharacterized protein n=1 Tax=Microbacterium allomyrinae TaxID=2830666 RepID=A0A9X1LTK7_9MICO|nr:hypothetical protein [Microbacterium allomyrinae]MCC2031804.1 hypothetical protein [Microbacterium allomyrinae]
MTRRPGIARDMPMRYRRDWHHLTTLAVGALATVELVALAVGVAVVL